MSGKQQRINNINQQKVRLAQQITRAVGQELMNLQRQQAQLDAQLQQAYNMQDNYNYGGGGGGYGGGGYDGGYNNYGGGGGGYDG